MEQDVVQENASQKLSRPSRKDISHTPLISPNPKRAKKFPTEEGEISNSVLFNAIQSLTRKFDNQCDHFKALGFQLKENTDAVVNIKESVDTNTSSLKGIIEDRLKKQVILLQKVVSGTRKVQAEMVALSKCCS